MYRINLLGASGTGKTTLGKALADELGYAHFDSDAYFHLPTDPPFQQQRDPDARTRMLLADLPDDGRWVLSGSVISWTPHPELAFDLIVFLYLPPDVRLERLRQRERERYGTRLDAGGDMHEDHQAFMTWSSGYDEGKVALNNLKIHRDWLERQIVPVLELNQPMTTTEQIERIVARMWMGMV